MFRSGYLTLWRWRGARVRLHWSIALGALVFGGFRFDPGFIVGFVVLVLLHEIGHALVAWRYGHRVRAIEVTGFGGACSWSGNATPFEEAAIAWGGVLAQAVLLAASYAAVRFAPPTTRFGFGLVEAFTGTNLWLIAVNLMPIPPLDGAKAWTIVRAWRERHTGPIPYGSWRDAGPNAQRAWLDNMKQKERPLPDKPSRQAQRAIDDLLKRATRGERDKQ